MPPPARKILSFFVLAALYFCLLTVPWPGPWSGPVPYLMEGYRRAYRATGNVLFVRMGDGGGVKFLPYSQSLHTPDTTVRLTNHRKNVSGSMEIKSIYTGYRPLAFFVALVLASPVPWRRRSLSLLFGLIIVGAFVAARTWLQLAVVLSGEGPLRVYAWSDAFRSFLTAVNAVFVRSPAVGYIVPAIIWAIVTLRRADWARFGVRIGPDPEQDDHPASTPGRGGKRIAGGKAS